MSKDSNIIAAEFNNSFINSVQEISQLFYPSDYDTIPINDAQPIFNIDKITEREVANIISLLNSSKAKDDFDLDVSIIKEHKEPRIPPITHMVNLSIKH